MKCVQKFSVKFALAKNRNTPTDAGNR